MRTDSTWTQVLSRTDYYPFGLEMTGRTESATYRYGFNGKEKDPSGQWSNQTHYDYGFRIYNPAIGKFLSVDPLTKEFSMLTPYQFAANMPIWANDLDGLEAHLTNQGVVSGPINKENYSFAVRLDERSSASGIADYVRHGTATFSTLAGGMKVLAENLSIPKVQPALKVKYFKDINGQKFGITYGERGSGRLKLTGVKMENPAISNLNNVAKTIGEITFIVDVSFLGLDAFEAGKKWYVTGDWNNEETGKFIYNSAGTAMGYYFPITGGVLLMKDITLAKDGEWIDQKLQGKFKEDFYKYQNSDYQKSNNARRRYYENGGKECLGCMVETELNQKK